LLGLKWKNKKQKQRMKDTGRCWGCFFQHLHSKLGYRKIDCAFWLRVWFNSFWFLLNFVCLTIKFLWTI
jgi:hypothetical protein